MSLVKNCDLTCHNYEDSGGDGELFNPGEDIERETSNPGRSRQIGQFPLPCFFHIDHQNYEQLLSLVISSSKLSIDIPCIFILVKSINSQN